MGRECYARFVVRPQQRVQEVYERQGEAGAGVRARSFVSRQLEEVLETTAHAFGQYVFGN